MKPDGTRIARPVRMFVSYSHENAAWSKRLLPVLRVKANVDTLQPWHDTELKAGDRWDKEIRAELERMDIFLCLEATNFSPPATSRAWNCQERRRATRTARSR